MPPAGINFRLSLCWIHSKNISLMRLLVVPAGMRKKHVQRKGSFRTEMNSDSGTLKTNALNCGISLTGKNKWVNTSGYFLSVTGLKWIYGNIYYRKVSLCHHSIIRMNAKSLTVMVSGMQLWMQFHANQPKPWKYEEFVAVPLGISPVPDL